MLWGLLLVWLCVTPLAAQKVTAELRLQVADPAGLPLAAALELTSQATQYHLIAAAGPDGKWIAKGLPFGPYRLEARHSGFAAFTALLDLRSEVPLDYHVTLSVAPVETAIQITDSATLLDPHRTGTVHYIGAEILRDRRAAEPSRAVLDQVQAQPGWLLEANGILHPRGSEYGVQYIVDGVPIQDNRSPGFAPSLEVEDLESMNVFTANYPAEYGRKLGGVVEVVGRSHSPPGLHGKAMLQSGSFDSGAAYLSGQYSNSRTVLGAAAQVSRTSRFLDPPVEANYTNRGSSGGASLRLERDLTGRDRIRLLVSGRQTRFLVPNELQQQEHGQRQDRSGGETMGQLSYQRVVTPRLLFSARGMVRDLSARLWSNTLATPIAADQDRGFREGYFGASFSWQGGGHEWKAGGETIHSWLREDFGYQITDRTAFDPEVRRRFRFAGTAQGSEQALYVQDLYRAGRWTFSAGLRADRYRLLLRDFAFSPRLGAAYHWEPAGMVFRFSYDRAFQTPASENLLLASSQAAQRLTGEVLALPVPPSGGDFYQAGFSKGVFGKLRLDGNFFRRKIRNFPDDDLLLNTGASFPIAFARADIQGFEAKLEAPRWGPVSGYVSYANLVGRGRLPITGGLFLEEGSAALLESRAQFPITQDQRNTLSGRLRGQLSKRAFVAAGAWYGSGLPIERTSSADPGAYSRRILERVNFSRGRLRPSHSFDLSGGVELWKREAKILRIQCDLLNFTGRLNVINFASLFSGTAIGAPRTFGVRMQWEF